MCYFSKQKSLQTRIEMASEAASGSILQTVRMQNEIKFQQNKQYKNRVHEYLAGALLASEIDPELVEVATALGQHRNNLDNSRLKTDQRKSRLLMPVVMHIANRPTFVENNGMVNTLKHLRLMADRSDASVFVTSDPGQPGQRTLWTACLQGGLIVDLQFSQSDGKKGVAFTYEPATLTKRSLFVCPKFAAAHPTLTATLY
jgi:hypothetical protein